MPKCSLTSLQLMANNGDCLIFEGEVSFAAGYSSTEGIVSYSGLWLRFSAISQTDLGAFSTVLKLENKRTDPFWNGNNWTDATYNFTITEAYMAFNINNNSFIKAGLIPTSIASLGHDKSYNFLGLRHDNFSLARVKESLYYFSWGCYYICTLPNTDYAIQLFSILARALLLA